MVRQAAVMIGRIMGTASAPGSNEVLPGWTNRAQLDRLIQAHRPPRVSLRTTSAAIASIASGVALVLAVWVGARYAAMVQHCTEEAARYPDASAYCEATPVLSSSGYDPHAECQRYRGESTLDVCVGHSPLHPRAVVGLAVVAVCLGVLALVLAGSWWLSRRSLPAWVDVLQRRPRDVCWVYLRTTTYVDRRFPSLRRSSSVLVLGLASRHALTIGATSAADAEELLRSVAPLIPWATIGHSDAAAAAFDREPRSLFRA